MASKSFTINGVGDITVYKRRGAKKINLRIVSGKVRVTQPTWLPYASGLQFASSNISWILQQQATQPQLKLYDGMLIGKHSSLTLQPGDVLRTRSTANGLTVYVPPQYHTASAEVIRVVSSAIKRLLKKEAEMLLPDRAALWAEKYQFEYAAVHCKSMKSRWGSCNSQKVITLNTFLLMAPWDLIDYVIVHELVHTKYLHHGADFWNAVEQIIPDYKRCRKDLKNVQASIAALQ